MSDVIRLSVQHGIARLVLCRPASRNSLGVDDMRDLGQRVAEAAKQARCLVVQGAEGSFCAGRDLSGIDVEREDTYQVLHECIHPTIAAVHDCPIPTIAQIEGPALGFGFGLAMACDMAIAADDAILGSPFRRIGCVPDSGAHWFLQQRIGRNRALELIYTGRLLSGREAAALGLVNRSIGRTDLATTVERMARQIAAGPASAFRQSKDLLRSAASLSQTFELEARAQAQAVKSADGREGIRAFLEKRAPVFGSTDPQH